MNTSSLHHGRSHLSVNGGQPIVVESVDIEFTPSTPLERVGWSLVEVTTAWRDLCVAVGITDDEFRRFRELLTIRHRQGSALLARHRRRRHR